MPLTHVFSDPSQFEADIRFWKEQYMCGVVDAEVLRTKTLQSMFNEHKRVCAEAIPKRLHSVAASLGALAADDLTTRNLLRLQKMKNVETLDECIEIALLGIERDFLSIASEWKQITNLIIRPQG